MKYTLAIAIAILAICALCFIFINVTTYFAPPLQPIFDQERLGQLGDFLGGTLNPIFGFATVCLLLWSVFIQRKELNLTRKELNKSAKALKKQVKISIDEYNRKQLKDLLSKKIKEYDSLCNQSFEPIILEWINDHGEKTRTEPSTIIQLIGSEKLGSISSGQLTPNHIDDILQLKIPPKDIHRRNTFLRFKNMTDSIAMIYIELIKITKNNQIKKHLTEEATTIINNAKLIHIPLGEYAKELLQKTITL